MINKMKVLTLLTISFLSFLSFSYEVKEGVLRTPDDRFENLENYPFEPNYMMIDGLRTVSYTHLTLPTTPYV